MKKYFSFLLRYLIASVAALAADFLAVMILMAITQNEMKYQELWDILGYVIFYVSFILLFLSLNLTYMRKKTKIYYSDIEENDKEKSKKLLNGDIIWRTLLYAAINLPITISAILTNGPTPVWGLVFTSQGLLIELLGNEIMGYIINIAVFIIGEIFIIKKFYREAYGTKSISINLKGVLTIMIPVMVVVIALGGIAASFGAREYAKKDLGIPSLERYPEPGQDYRKARNVWDMAIFEGSLYIGSGDYGTNQGPVHIWKYNIAAKKWSKSDSIPDEQINRFVTVNEKLMAPGIDPRGDWDLGNYYVLEDGNWVVNRVIPSGVHCFDIVEYKGSLFFGIDGEGAMPAARSDDGGNTFMPVELIDREGKPVVTAGRQFCRIYDFISYNDGLYAVFLRDDIDIAYDIYKYDGEKFVFYSDAFPKKQVREWYVPIGGKVVFKDYVYITNGYLYRTKDFKAFNEIELKEGYGTVFDLAVDGDRILALVGLLAAGSYRTAVLESTDGINFNDVLQFVENLPARSFAYDKENDCFYFGLGSLRADHEDNGKIIMMK